MRQETRDRLVRLLIVGAVCLAASSAMRAQKPGKIGKRGRQTVATPAKSVSRPFARPNTQPSTHTSN